jgi:3-hydroxymyristoyl/3-hydroxydecanoyl-(acyl carrier protein) dehydratase
VEWLCRQRMRRRLRATPMQTAAARLASHPWVTAAMGGSAGGQRPGVVVALSASGRTALCRHGRAGLIGELGQHAAGDDALATPMAWRFVDSLPDPAHVDLVLQAPLPRMAQVVAERHEGDTCILSLALPLDLACFVDHFPVAPVLPGVLQIAWALEFASSRFGTPTGCRGMDQLKFQRLLRPGDRVELALRYDPARGRLHFAYRIDGAACSSAHLRMDTLRGAIDAR